METKRKRKKVDYKDPSSSPPEISSEVSKYGECVFKDYTSKFDYIEEEALRIKVDTTDNFYTILGWAKEDCNDDKNMPDYLKKLYLDSFSTREIGKYFCKDFSQLDGTISSFLKKLSRVIINNYEDNRT